jgi:predicted acylesterase/phospholipase RssA/GTPase Era involved in 16S rRNA processing
MTFKKLGITLSGGGGKGAYQIGVWKALRDHQIDTQIAAISGTSVGGLNGAMMAQGTYDKAEAMWLNIESRNMLTLQDIDWVTRELAILGASQVISPLLMSFIQTKGLFKRDGLQSMLDEGLDADLLARSTMPLTVALHDAEANRVIYQPIREARIANNALLATAALPRIFADVAIDGVAFTDGGFYWGLPQKRLDNTPIRPLVEAGCDTIIVVCLSQDDLSVTPRQFPGVRVLPIVPSRQLGNVAATLDFSNDGAARRMEQGYADASHLLQHLGLFLSNEDQYQALWQRMTAGAGQEKDQRTRLFQLDQQHTSTVADIGDFDRTVSSDDFTSRIDLTDDDTQPPALDMLTLNNTALLVDLERQRIETDVDRFLTQNENNRRSVEGAVLDALATLSPVSGRADHLHEQGVLMRFWGAITGKNQKLSAENDHALAQAQFAALRLIAAVQQKGAITLEFTCALQNRLVGAFHEIERLDQRQQQDLRHVYRSLAGVYTQLRNRLMQHENRLAVLERQGRLHSWLLHPNKSRHQGLPLASLPVPQRLACLANEFFQLTHGHWEVEELVSLKEMCLNVGLGDDAPVRVVDFCTALLQERDTAEILMEQLAEPAGTLPLQIEAAAWLRDLRQRCLPESASPADALIRWNYHADTALPAWDFLAELLYYMCAAGLVPLQHSELDQTKAHWLEQLGVLTTQIRDGILPTRIQQDIDAVQQTIRNFKLAVPLVGQFSVGKSTLLNAWLGQAIQPDDLLPCTSLATEFHSTSAGQEKLVVHWRQPDQSLAREEYPLTRYPDLLAGRLAAGREVLFIELHRHLPALSRHPDLVLVDTPGLGSNRHDHDQALAHYLGEGVVFILCVTRISQVGKAERAFVERQRALGQSFSLLVCQEDLINLSEREKLRQTVREQAGLDDDQLVRGCSARGQVNLTGFEDILGHIEQHKTTLFQQHLAPKVKSLLSQAERLIRQQLSENTSAEKLHDQKTAISQSMAALKTTYEQEEQELLRDVHGAVQQQILSTVNSFLRGRRSAYVAQLLEQQPIASLLAADAQNAFQLAVEKTLTPRLQQAAQALGRHVPYGGIKVIQLGEAAPDGQMANSNGWGGTSAGAAAGAAIGSMVPMIGTLIGGVIGGLLGFLGAKRSQQSEAESQVVQAIESIIGRLQSMAKQILQSQACQFLEAVRQQIEAQIQIEQQNLDKLDEQLQVDATRRKELEQKTRSALHTVEQLLNPSVTAKKE